MLAALGCGAFAAPGSAPAEDAVWNGSYAADGACHCVGELDPGVAVREVDTPLGRRSVALACDAVGPGPGLEFDGEAWDRTVYPDAQCGNGPFADGVELLDPECAGTRRPGEADCRPIGPRWDLASAYASAPAIAAAGPTEAATARAPAADAPIVEIDGIAWRAAPPGTPRSGGRPGSRIILDDEVWLRADDPRFAELDATDGEARRAALRRAAGSAETEYAETPASTVRPAASAAATAPTEATAGRASSALPDRSADGRRWREAPEEPLAESPEEPFAESAEALRERRRAEVAERRRLEVEREAEREAALADATESVDPVEPAAEPAVLAAALPEPEGAADATGDAGPALADADAPPPVTESAGAVAATAPGESGAETAAPLAALRLPAGVRGSSDEYGYVEAMPKAYEIGGAGIGLEASGEARGRFHYLARVGAAESYREVALGAGVHVTPPDADRLTFALTGGAEYGAFEIVGTDGERTTSLTDDEAGLFVELSSRLVVNPRFELSGGVGYSSFHEGDPHGFGGAFFHVNRRLDLMSRFEVGDNDQLGIGLRYFY